MGRDAEITFATGLLTLLGNNRYPSRVPSSEAGAMGDSCERGVLPASGTLRAFGGHQTRREQHSRSETGIHCQGTLFQMRRRVHSFRPPTIRDLFRSSSGRTQEFRMSAQCSQMLGYSLSKAEN